MAVLVKSLSLHLAKPGRRLPRELVESLQSLQTPMDVLILGNLLWVTLLWQGKLNLDALQRSLPAPTVECDCVIQSDDVHTFWSHSF